MAAIIYFLPLPPLFEGISYSRAVFDENRKLLRLTLAADEQYRLYTPLKSITRSLQEATLLQEDQYFRWHPGINPLSLLRAGWQTYAAKQRRVGASTITMQVARMRYNISSRTLSGKCWQMLRALQLEAHYSKDQILEAYLNLAPYGNNIQGVGAASLVYFGKEANVLSLPEALTLTVIPQNPGKRLPERGILKTARGKLYQRWITLHPDDGQQQALFDLPLQMRRLHDTPFLAPHFANAVLGSQSQQQLITTLDLRLQSMIEHVTRQYLARKSVLGINNAAVLLVDTRSMEVKALLGSAGFMNTAIAGQIDGTHIRRSPGSTLKPFIYALAIDQGLIHPNTVLRDVPHSFGSYNPENFDNDFAGPIKAKDALVLSRNIPAITLADQLREPSLYQFLQQADVQHLKSEAYYGLSLVLGGAELSMQELSGLYAALANEGLWQPLRFTKDEERMPGKRILSAEASYLVLDMLRESHRPANIHSPQNKKSHTAWKTGTSSGFRDAWTVGVIGPYVLTVWLGNFNNDSNPSLIGKEIAAPLFFEIAAALNSHSKLPEPPPPHGMNLKKVAVCKISGMLPSHACPDTEEVWFIPGKSPIKTDTIHREVTINRQNGLRTCRFDENTRFAVYEFWPSDALQILKRAGMQPRTPPPYEPGCNSYGKIGEGFQPQILSPQTQVSYIARPGTGGTAELPLTVVADGDVKQVYWFVNEEFLGKSSRDQSFLWHARPGQHIIRVVDDFGRSDARKVNIQLENH